MERENTDLWSKVVNIGPIEAFGIFGSFASILGLFIAAPGWRSKVIHVGYALFMVAIITWFMDYQRNVKESLSELERIKRIETQAEALLKPRDLSTEGLKVGYMLAALAFLEKNKALYPDTYERAKKVCESASCTEVTSGVGTMDHFARLQQGASAMHALLEGVSKLGAN